MRTLLFVAVVALALPLAAVAKLQGDLRMCGGSGCRIVDKHRGHDVWPVVLPAPRLMKVVVGDRRVANDANSYLRLFRLSAPDEAIPDPAGSRPQPGDTKEIVAYARRVERHWIRVFVSSQRESPWSDGKTSLWVGRKVDLISRDGEIVRVSHALAERIRRAESLR